MSGDRVAVPTNGHRPPLTDDALDAPHHDADAPHHDADAPQHDASESGEEPVEKAVGRSERPAAASLTPGLAMAGLGLIAGLALLVGRRRRG
jgi:hypothetical protein